MSGWSIARGHRKFYSITLALAAAAAAPPALAAGAFNYSPLTEPVLSASFSVDLAELTAHQYIFGHQVNMVMLLDLTSGGPSLDLSDDLFDGSNFPGVTPIDQAVTETQVFTVPIDPAFWPALEDGCVGLWALFTDTRDAVFAIDTIFLTIETASATITPYYGSPNDGYHVAVADNDHLPGALPDSLAATGTGFDEPISSKAVHVPEPAMLIMLGAVAAIVFGRRRLAPPVAVARVAVVALLASVMTSNAARAAALDGRAGWTAAAAVDAHTAPQSDRRDGAQRSADRLAGGGRYVPGEVLVIFRQGTNRAAAEQALQTIGAREIDFMANVRVHHVRTPPGMSVSQTVALLSADPTVQSASPNFIYFPAGHLTTPNDPEFRRQWYMNNTGDNLNGVDPNQLSEPIERDGIIDADIDAPQGWEHTTDCSRQIVAVFDAGVDVQHPDFGGKHPAGNIWLNPNDPNDGFDTDDDLNGVANDINGASFAAFEVHSERQEAHVERVEAIADSNTNMMIDAADQIYHDFDTNARVNNLVDDLLTAGPADPNGTQLFLLGNLKHRIITDNSIFDDGEGIFKDMDDDDKVDAGEVIVDSNPASAVGDDLEAFRTLQDGYQDGETIYWDVDANGQISAPDQRIQGPASPNGAALSTFGNRVKHTDNINANMIFDMGEGIFLDADDDNKTDNGEVLTDPNRPPGQDLFEFPLADGVFRKIDAIYVDQNGDLKVDVGDTHIAGPAQPNETALSLFGDLVKHTENINANMLYDAGEGIFVDNNPENDQTDNGEVLLDPNAAPGTALIPFTCRPNNNITDVTGHGTNCAGIIGARGNNNLNIAGVCWKVQLLTVKVATAGGSPNSAVCKGIDYIIDLKNAGNNIRLVNYSFGGAGYSQVLKDCMETAGNNGILFIVAAGNDATDNDPNDGQYSEAIYRDADPPGPPPPDGLVGIGDTRLTTIGQPNNQLAPGAVAAGSPNIGKAIIPFPEDPMNANIAYKHTDVGGANATFEEGERIYIDADASGDVSVGDARLTFFVSLGFQHGAGPVVVGDLDIGDPLRKFLATEGFVDRFMQSFNGEDGQPAGQAAQFPCAFDLDNIICVAASTNHDVLTDFSAWGEVSVDLAAPGKDILTLQRAAAGGGTVYVPGTSFATPIVTGICAHFWSLSGFENYTIAELRKRILEGVDTVNGVAHDHGVDPRYGLRNSVVSGIDYDGRARITCGDDFGDAPDGPYPTQGFNDGARHEDMGEEWLGRDPNNPYYGTFGDEGPGGSDVSPEFEAFDCCWPPDPDGVQNLVDMDKYDDGIDLVGPYTFSPFGGPPNKAKVRVWITTENNTVNDDDAGRYPVSGGHGGGGHFPGDGVHGPNDDKHVWVNGWFDWNRDGDWDDPNEQVFMLCANPSDWVPDRSGVFDLEFNMPAAPADLQEGELWARFRLDYGQNSGQRINPMPNMPHIPAPSLGARVRYWDDPNGLPAGIPPEINRYEAVTAVPVILTLTRGIAEFGEVEDYFVSGDEPDQLHLLGPLPNMLIEGDSGSILATVEDNFNGLIGQDVKFETLVGDITFNNGMGAGSNMTTLTTNTYGQAEAEFTANSAGYVLVRASVLGTNLSAYLFFEVQRELRPEPPQLNGGIVAPAGPPNRPAGP